MFLFATCVYLRGNLRVRLVTQRKFLRKFNLRPLATTDRQVAASGRKLNLRRNLRWVTKRTRKFPRKYTQIANKNILRQSILYFIG